MVNYSFRLPLTEDGTAVRIDGATGPGGGSGLTQSQTTAAVKAALEQATTLDQVESLLDLAKDTGAVTAKTIRATIADGGSLMTRLGTNGAPASATGSEAAQLRAIAEAAIKPTLTRYRTTALNATKQEVKASAGDIYQINAINLNSVPVYVKIYNALASGVTEGSTTPLWTIAIPANGVTTEPNTGFPQAVLSTGITIACTTELADSGTTAPATAIHFSVRHS